MNGKTDHVWHVWINSRNKWDHDLPCRWCGKSFDEHGEPGASPMKKTRHDRLCPVEGVTSQFFAPKIEPPSIVNPPMRTMYAWKAVTQFIQWAPRKIKEAMTGGLPMVHQQCSHCAPEKLDHNTLRCWLGQDVAQCPILLDVKRCFDEERSRTIGSEKKSYYADITDDDVYEVMGSVCGWHLFMSDIATKQDMLPPGRFVDWNEGAFQDESDRRFWSNVYDSMAAGVERGDESGPVAGQ